MEDKNSKSKLIMCDCYSHILQLEYDSEWKQMFMAFWSCGHNGEKLSFIQKIRWVWTILTKGHPYADDICLSHEKIIELSDFVNKVREQINDTKDKRTLLTDSINPEENI